MSLADDVAEPYAATAAQAIQRIHDLEPGDFHRWLYTAMRDLAAARGRAHGSPTVTDWVGLASMLALAGRKDVEFEQAVQWFRDRAGHKAAGVMAELGVNQEQRKQRRLGEVQRLVGLGYDSARIAGVLGVTQRSVDRYLSELGKGEAA